MEKIKVMVSSVVRGLEAERDAIQTLFAQEKFQFVELVGATPYSGASMPASSAVATVKWARECQLYILVLGNEYGTETETGKSATEAEFDAAYQTDPTKVLVFLKEVSGQVAEDKQAAFIKRVSDYYNGYFRTSFQFTHQLQTLVNNTFWEWLIKRTQIGTPQTHIADHFIRMVKENVPIAEMEIFYRTCKDRLEIDAHYNGKIISMHFDNAELHANFWKNVYTAQTKLDQFWRD